MNNPIDVIKKLGAVPHKFGDRVSAEYPFFMSLLDVDIVESDEVPAAAVTIRNNRVVMLVNTKALNEIADEMDLRGEEREAWFRAIGKHELLHFMLGHLLPSPERPVHIVKNIVMDALINRMIREFEVLIDRKKIKVIEPEEMVEKIQTFEPGSISIFYASSEAYHNWTWEEYYDRIIDQIPEAEYAASAQGGSNKSDGEDSSGGSDRDSKDSGDIKDRLKRIAKKVVCSADIDVPGDIPPEIAQKMEEAFERLVNTLKQRGELPGWIERTIEVRRKNRSKLKLKKLVRATFVHGYAMEKRDTWKRPSRRFGTFPGQRYKTVKRRAIALVDVSGSVSDNELIETLQEIYAISRSYGYEFKIYTYDVGIKKELSFHEVKRNGLQTDGGGGTDLRQTLAELDEDVLNGSFVFVFTDGYDDPPAKDDFKGAREIVFVFYPEHSVNFMKAVSEYATTAVLD